MEKEKDEKLPKEETKKTRPKQGKSSKGKPISEKLEQSKKAKESLPPFPPGPKDLSGRTNFEEEEELPDFEALDIEDFCKDLVGATSEIAHIINKKIRVCDEKEKKIIGRPLSRVIIDHELQKYAKNEFLLLAGLTYVVYKRVREVKAADNSPEKDVKNEK